MWANNSLAHTDTEHQVSLINTQLTILQQNKLKIIKEKLTLK